MTGIRRTAVVTVLGLILALPIATGGAASATPGPSATAPSASSDASAVQLELPRPTGPHAVGVSTLHLVDEQRQDPWVPSAGPRQLMVSMYYPARPDTGVPAPFMTTEEASLFLQAKAPGANVPAGVLAGTRTWAYTDARPTHGRFPLVLLSPGFTLPRQTLTGLAEDLASRGYAVALVDHTYEDSGTTFPDGRTLTCAVCDRIPGGFPAVEESRAADLSFVIDQLTHRHSQWRYARMIDRERIGIAGHSAGGASAATTMVADDRVRAGVNLDGTFDVQIPTIGLNGRPFMLLGAQADHSPGGQEDSWSTAWARLDGWKRWLLVAGAVHDSFTDLPDLAAQVGLPSRGASISGQRSEEITRTYVAAFFDQQLKGIAQPLLDGPSPANPEVTFQQP
ncbi:alpha/beta hydrolase family protein [Streptomyces sp. GS7]|uniref:alpha/beta hydrolase family protein n=1 Tax=Streptomyces sp. GS7 TaxID=2692234 RepID=UPI001319A648|nr:alpha/beta hydrolase [Streptomyces sp. GS7]QHC21466.1 alpha/beta hydrolase [Streptomyces sp. GS7]